MAVVAKEQEHFEEIHDDADVTAWSARRAFVVYNPDDPDTVIGSVAAKNADGVPRLGDALPGRPRLLVESKDAKALRDNRSSWAITVNYSVFAPNPLLKPVEVFWNFGTETETFAFDYSSPSGP